MAENLPEGVDPQTVLTDVTVGKYRFIYHMDAKKPQGFRNGLPHGPTTENMTNNSVRALIERVAELEGA